MPAAGFGSTPSLKTPGLQVAQRKAEYRRDRRGRQGLQRHRRLQGREHRRVRRSRRQAARPRTFKQYPECAEVQGLPAHVRQGEPRTSTRYWSPARTTCTARRRMWAMARGKHVYCQKPLTRTVWEAQELEQGGRQIRSGHADGQPGLLQRRRARVLPRSSGTATSAT